MSGKVIDSHAHIFPYLGGSNGWNSESEHLGVLQEIFRIGEAYETKDINFRIGKFGRFEWTYDNVDYYTQVMPPLLVEQISTPEFMIAQMEHAGVDMAVLQNTKAYGKLNEYFAECVKKYPSRFIGLAEIDELEADKENIVSKLNFCVQELGLKGIFYDGTRFLKIGSTDGFNEKRFDLFWNKVSDLGITVFWFLDPNPSVEKHFEQMEAFSNWADRFPNIPAVLAMGFSIIPYIKNDKVEFPKGYLDNFKKQNIHVELLYPINAEKFLLDYPYSKVWQLIRQQYEVLGPDKLIWGSDMPNVARNCTYRQCLTYLKDYCTFIKDEDMDLILGGNIERLLKIPSDVPVAPLGPKRVLRT